MRYHAATHMRSRLPGAIDVPLFIADAQDDEFGGNTLDAKWTRGGNVFQTQNLTTTPGWLILGKVGSTDNTESYLYQSPPSLPFHITARAEAVFANNYAYGGIYIWQDASHWAMFGLIYDGGHRWWGKADGSDRYNINPATSNPAWIRVEVPPAIPNWYVVRYSTDGAVWRVIWAGSLNLTPNRIGVTLHPNNTSATEQKIKFDYFRVNRTDLQVGSQWGP